MIDEVIKQLALSLPVAGAIYASATKTLNQLLTLGRQLIESMDRLAAALESKKKEGE